MKIIKKIKRAFNKVFTPMMLGIPLYSTRFFRHICHKNFLQGIAYGLSKRQKALNKIKNVVVWDEMINLSLIYSELCHTKTKIKCVLDARDLCCYYAATACRGQSEQFRKAVLKHITAMPHFNSLTKEQVGLFVSTVECKNNNLLDFLK